MQGFLAMTQSVYITDATWLFYFAVVNLIVN